MKKIVFIVFLLLIIFFYWVGTGYFKYSNNQNKSSRLTKSENTSPTISKPTFSDSQQQKETKSIFIPYWSLDGEGISSAEASYDRIIYFGVVADQAGINKADPGYIKIEKFIEMSSQARLNQDVNTKQPEKLITLRMLNSETNFFILKNPEIQKKIIENTINIAEKYKFSGIMLDFELFSLFNDEISSQINDFVHLFYTNTKGDNLHFAITLYGDIFYRKRPFDVDFLSKNTDEILVMAYDFHKSGGEPGPNFPLMAGQKYGYDFKQMIDDYLKYVPREKLTIIFGMFGYDWAVDEKKRPINKAKSLSLNEIKKNFLTKCQWQDCVVKRNDLSKETEVNYVTSEIKNNFAYLYYHVVWFEDEESVKIKNQFLKEKDINSVAYWAWGYF